MQQALQKSCYNHDSQSQKVTMKFLQETTVWDAGFKVPNHVYYMNDSKTKAVGYIREGSAELTMFSVPMSIITKGRTFKELPKKGEDDSVYFSAANTSSKQTMEVEGSNGKKYTLTKSGLKWTCNCPGYTFRNTCKHIALKGN